MQVVTIASGSKGNCSLISDGKTNILIDAGISMRRIVSALSSLGLAPRDICGVLITHEHSDHISGLKMLEKYHGLDIIAPSPLCEVLARACPEAKPYLRSLPEDDKSAIGSFAVSCFRTQHDAAYSVGYRIEGDEIFGLATDTGCVTDEIFRGLEGADIALIEANHDIDMLKNGPYPYYLKQRILSNKGHLSNSDSGKLASALAKGGTKHIILGHLSHENNTPRIALETVGAAVGDDCRDIRIAPQNEMLRLETDLCSL